MTVGSLKTAVMENQAELIKLPILMDFKEDMPCEY